MAKEKNKVNSMQEVGKLVPDIVGMSWEEAKIAMTTSKCVRSVLWPEGEFMWEKAVSTKKASDDRGFYPPITQKYLAKIGVDKIIIGKHTNRFSGNSIWVGYRPIREEKLEDWIEYIP
jgi:hypothetical protein